MVCTAPGGFSQTKVFSKIEQASGCRSSLGVNAELMGEDDEGNAVLNVPTTHLAHGSAAGAQAHFPVAKYFANSRPTMCPMTSCSLYEAGCTRMYEKMELSTELGPKPFEDTNADGTVDAKDA